MGILSYDANRPMADAARDGLVAMLAGMYTGAAGITRALCSISIYSILSLLLLQTAATGSKPRSSYISIHAGLYTVYDEPY
jgi:hypothetical protein